MQLAQWVERTVDKLLRNESSGAPDGALAGAEAAPVSSVMSFGASLSFWPQSVRTWVRWFAETILSEGKAQARRPAPPTRHTICAHHTHPTNPRHYQYQQTRIEMAAKEGKLQCVVYRDGREGPPEKARTCVNILPARTPTAMAPRATKIQRALGPAAGRQRRRTRCSAALRNVGALGG